MRENKILSQKIKEEIKELSEKYENLRNLAETFNSRNLYVPYELYRRTIKGLLDEFNKYEFVERHIRGENAFNYLEKFLESGRNVLVVSGEGGCGKTRLAIEFAKRIEGNWDIYFVRQYPHFIKETFGDKTLLIVDDATKEGIPIENIVDLGAKVLILDRPHNIDSIKSRLSDRTDFDTVSLGEERDAYAFVSKLGIDDEEVKNEIVKKNPAEFSITS